MSECICHELARSSAHQVEAPSLKEKVILDLGCGSKKLKGSLGIDIRAFPGVDAVCDLNRPDWPIRNGSVDAVWGNQIIEHVDDVIAFLESIHRCVKVGADVVLLAPHYTSVYAWSDPTHRRAFGILSFDYAVTYLPGMFEVVHRFFGRAGTTPGLRGKVLAALNARLDRQVAFERWVSPLVAAGTLAFHLRATCPPGIRSAPPNSERSGRAGF